MNVFDFDNTIYAGDSSVDFFRYCLRVQPGLWRYFPARLLSFLPYFLHRCDKTRAKQNFYAILRRLPGIEARVGAFWDAHIERVKPWYPAMQRADDVVISASPEFLILPACERLGIRTAMASKVDPQTGVYTGVNCHGQEKVRRFYERFPDGRIDAFYSDSLSDAPLAALAEKAWLVKGDEMRPWPKD